MNQRKLGSSSLMISTVAVGTWSYGSNEGDYWGKQEQVDVDMAVKGAIDKGINFFDTALVYNGGRSEEALGKAIKGMRDKVIICDKIHNRAEPKDFEKTVDLMLKHLDMEYMDLLLLHWPCPDMDDNKGRLNAMVKMIDTGKVKNIGVSNFGLKQLDSIKEFLPYVSANEMSYNILSRGIESSIIKKCMDNKIGIIGYSPLFQGLLTGKYKTIDEIPSNYARTRHFKNMRGGQAEEGFDVEEEIIIILKEIKKISEELNISPAQLSLAWSIAKPGIATTIVGCRNERQLNSNVNAAALTLPKWAMDKIDELSWPIVEKISSSPDYYHSNDKGRIY